MTDFTGGVIFNVFEFDFPNKSITDVSSNKTSESTPGVNRVVALPDLRRQEGINNHLELVPVCERMLNYLVAEIWNTLIDS